MILPAVVSNVRRVPVFYTKKQKRREKRGRLQWGMILPAVVSYARRFSGFLYEKKETTQTPGLRRFRMIRVKINELN